MPKKQTDGRYRAKITVGHTIEGKPVFKYVSGRTMRELEDEKQAAIKYYVDGTGLEKDRLFGEYAIEWYRIRKEPYLSESSKASYKSMLNKHILPSFEDRMLRAITANNLQEFLNGYAGKSDTTITLICTILRGVFSSAYAGGIVPRNCAEHLTLPKASPVQARRALTEDETKSLLPVMGTHEYGSLLAVLYYLGLRRGEALGLQWGDFDWAQKLVHIQRDVDFTQNRAGGGEGIGGLKTAAADRYVTVPDALIQMLHPKCNAPEAFLFPAQNGSPLAKATFERIWLSLMREAGLAVPREGAEWKQVDARAEWSATITPHYLRHNYITLLYDAGVDPLIAMRMVGHADYQTTANIYTHLKNVHLQKVAAKLDNAFSKKVAEKLPAKNSTERKAKNKSPRI